jgi:hypothetical protein
VHEKCPMQFLHWIPPPLGTRKQQACSSTRCVSNALTCEHRFKRILLTVKHKYVLTFSLAHHTTSVHRDEHFRPDSSPFHSHELGPCAIHLYKLCHPTRYTFRAHDTVLGATFQHTHCHPQICTFPTLHAVHPRIHLRTSHHRATRTDPCPGACLRKSHHCRHGHHASGRYLYHGADRIGSDHRRRRRWKRMLCPVRANGLRTILRRRCGRLRISWYLAIGQSIWVR